MSYNRGGYSRGGGGYRGGNRGGVGDSSWRGSNRGNFSGSSRGRYFTASSPSNNYESRSRSYFQGGKFQDISWIEPYGGNNDRYSNRGRNDDSYRSYRSQDNQEYSGGREFNMRLSSPDPPRKRMRTDSSSYAGAPSRRSHERSFGSTGNDYPPSRSYYVGDKGGGGGGGYGGGGDKGSSYREVRDSRTTEYSFRKPSLSSRSPRGSFRGRTSFSSVRGSRGRGAYPRSSVTASAFLSRKRGLAESYAIRKRYISSKSQDYLRRLKLYRLKRRFKDEDMKNKKTDDEDEDDEGDDVEEDKEHEEEEEEEEEGEVEEVSSQEGHEADEKEEGEVDGDIKEEEEPTDEIEEKEKSAKKKTPVKKPVKKVTKKVVVKKKPEAGDSKNSDGGKRVEDEGQSSLTNYLGQPYIRLKCPHCRYSCVTFKEYGYHLGLKKHQMAMRSLSTKLRQSLARMRVEQRQKQRILDEECKAQGNLHLRTFFCNVCKLNYKTLKSQHQATIAHKKMREFLLPFCKICRLAFKSPMLFEAHICDLSHIKRKAKLDRLKAAAKELDEEVDSGNELDTNSFMILDAVGSGDEDSDGEKSEVNEEGEEAKAEGDKKVKEEKEDAEKKKKKKSEIKLGSEYCKLVEAYYCELCKTFLPRFEDKKKALTVHCRSRIHLQRWTRDMKNLRRKASKIKERSSKTEKKGEEDEEEEEEDEEVVVGKSKKDGEGQETENKNDMVELDAARNQEGGESRKNFTEEGLDVDEKMWSAVDKDLSELLNEAEEATKSSDEDDDSRPDGGRYDRFKHSDKNNTDKSETAKDLKRGDEEEEEAMKTGANQSNGSVSQSEKKIIEESSPK